MKLTNSEILGAKVALGELSKLKLPVRCSMQVAKLDLKLTENVSAFAKVRDGLFTKYNIKPTPSEGKVEFTSEQGAEALNKFSDEFNELLSLETEVVFEKVKLPEKIASTCDACHHNMDKPLEIEPDILKSLVDFVEIV